MRINKYNKPKEVSGNRIGSTTVISNVVTNTEGGYTDTAKRLADTHSIFGQPFNGTQDISGDITDARSITLIGGDVVVNAKDNEGGCILTDGSIDAGGGITSGGNISANGTVSGTKFIGDVEADDITTNTFTAESGNITNLSGTSLNFASGELRNAIIDALQSTEITTENLIVTKQAHFFELIIDKIKAAGGAIILSPADGFKVQMVSHCGNHWRLFWKATDGEKKISNMWKVGDQAICQTFNASVGTYQNVSNKYYWGLVTYVGTQNLGDQDYHYIGLSMDDYDGTLNPEIGDEIAMLGYRGTDDASRQNAIYISSYASIDPTINAPLFCHYKGINDFNLSSHKYTWFASNGNQIRGNLLIESGQTVEDYVDYQAITITSTAIEYAHSTNGSTPPTTGWSTTIPSASSSYYLWTRTTVNYSDGTTTVSYSVGKNGAKGDTGADGSSYSGNILFGTKDFSGGNWVNKQYWVDTGEEYKGCKVYSRSSNTYGIYQMAEVEAGKTYTFSAYIKSDGGDIRYYMDGIGTAVVTPQNKDVPESNNWERVGVTFRCTTSGTVGCRVQKATGTGTVYVAGFKLEEGTNNNTVWTPHITEMKGDKGDQGIQGEQGEQGEKGDDAEFYKMIPVIRRANVSKNDVLSISLSYYIAHIKGSDVEYIDATSDGYHIIFRAQGILSAYNLSYGGLCTYSNPSYISNYSESTTSPQFLSVQLLDGNGNVCDQDYIPITFDAAATLQITDEIKATVQGNSQAISDLQDNVLTNTNSISTITQQYNSISSTVESHTSSINTISGQVTQNTTDISNITQTADNISLRVSNIENTTANNLLLGTNREIMNWVVAGENQTYTKVGFTMDSLSASQAVKCEGTGVVFARTSEYPEYPSTQWEFLGYKINPTKIISGKKYTLSFRVSVGFDSENLTNLRRTVVPSNAPSPRSISDDSLPDLDNGFEIGDGIEVDPSSPVTPIPMYQPIYFNAMLSNGNTSNKLANSVNTNTFSPVTTAAIVTATLTATRSGKSDDEGMLVYLEIPQIFRHLWRIIQIWDIKLEEGEVATSWCEAPEDYTDYDSAVKEQVAELTIRADQISARVDEVALTVTDRKIILDGETEVNGTVNVNRDGTGFRLNGSSGESFTIGSNDIGTYSDFESRTQQNWWHIFNQSTVTFSGSNKEVKVSSLCTTLKSGQRLRITNLYLKTTDYNFANSQVRSATINIYRGSVTPTNKVALITITNPSTSNGYWYQGTSQMNGSKSALIDYTATANGDYYIEIVAELSGASSGYTYLDAWAACEISLNAFGNLTYNGFGFNFGGGKVAFIGNDAMIFKMGADAGLKITSANGLQRLVPESHIYASANIMHHYTNSAQWIGVNDYKVRVISDLSGTYTQGTIDMVSPQDEMLVVRSTSNPIIMVLPTATSCAGKSYVIKNYSSSDNVFVGTGTLTTTNAAGNIISASGNIGYNDSCGIVYSGSTTTYRQLMKCGKYSHQLISDGNKWIDCILV